MKVESRIKKGFKILIVIVALLFMQATVNDKKIFRVENFHLNKQFGVSAEASKVEEEEPVVIDENYVTKATYTGDLTGYSADCPMCNGTLACKPSYKVYKNNIVTYNDEVYGNVRIVASSKQLACGSIIRFNSSRISDEPILAIVLDRGVLNRNLDLLVPNESYAYKYVGRSKITYEVLRNGW